MPAPSRVDADRLRTLDGLVVFWTVFCLVIGTWVGYELWQLARLGTSLAEAGRGLDDAGRALQELRDIPVVGQAPGAIGDEVRSTAQDAVVRGDAAAQSTRRLAVLLGLVTALVPLVPVLWWYLPARLARAREVAQVRRMLAEQDAREVDGYLADCAVRRLPYERLRTATDSPWRDYADGRHRGLADLELARLGISRRTG